MKYIKLLKRFSIALGMPLFLLSCNAGSNNASISGTPTSCPIISQPQESNYLTVRVTANGDNKGLCSLVNSPCVTVKICSSKDESNCTEIKDILLDSGSSGLRIFKERLRGLQLPNYYKNNQPVYECMQFIDGNQLWGSVNTAHIIFDGGVREHNLNVQVIDQDDSNLHSFCKSSISSPAAYGYNGVLGVSPLINDKGIYYQCSNNKCVQTDIAPLKGVANPIRFLDKDNNGIMIELPDIPESGCGNATGYAVFGVNTASDNIMESQVTKFKIATSPVVPLYIKAIYGGEEYHAYLDTGSNTISLDNGNTPVCTINSMFYCPLLTQNNIITLTGVDGGSTQNYSLSIANAGTLFTSGNTAFNNLASIPYSSLLSHFIDLGLPFFYGKKVYIGFESEPLNSESDMYWAF